MFKMFLLKIYWRILHSFHSYFFTIFTNLWIKKFNQRYQFSSYEHEINDHEHELNDHIAANHGGILGMLTLSSGKAIQVSQFQNLNANFAQIFFRVYHNHRYKSWDMIIKIWIHIENVYHWAMSILISECQFCTNIFSITNVQLCTIIDRD